ncbi:MAG: hypothetical protein AAFV33_17450 [Chloroflexota bacterium]
MTNPLFVPVAIGLVTILAVVFVKGIVRFIRPMIGLTILGMSVWYLVHLLRTAQVIVLVQPADPAFYMVCFIIIVLSWYGIQLLQGDREK